MSVPRMNRLGKAIVILLFLLIGGFFLLKGVHNFRLYKTLTNLEKEFIGNLAAELKQGHRDIRISKLTSFDWETVCFLEQYSIVPSTTSAEKIREILPAVTNPEQNKDKIPDMSDEINRNAFVFTNNGKITEVLKFHHIFIKADGKKYYYYGAQKHKNCASAVNATLFFKDRQETGRGGSIYFTDGGGDY